MMDHTAITARLESLGLRLPEAELPAFATLAADMATAAAIAAGPLEVGDEPASVFRLPPPA